MFPLSLDHCEEADGNFPRFSSEKTTPNVHSMYYMYLCIFSDKHDKAFSEVESALKVSTVIDWMKEKHKWKRLQLEMPAIVNDSLRHQITSSLREYLRAAKSNN